MAAKKPKAKNELAVAIAEAVEALWAIAHALELRRVGADAVSEEEKGDAGDDREAETVHGR